MRRLILYSTLSLVFFLSNCQLGFAQYYSSGDLMNDIPFKDMMSDISDISSSTSSYNSSWSTGKKDREDRENAYEARWRIEEANRQAAKAEIRAADAERKAAEAERILKEKEFLISKNELQLSLRGGKTNRLNRSYGKGLRGLSDYQNSNDDHISYSSGLRGFSEDFDEQSGSSTGNTGDVVHVEINNRVIPQKSNTKRPVSNEASKRNNDFYQYESVYIPEPVYYSPSAYFVMGASESQDDPWLDRFEQQIDVWREAGEHKVLSYVGDKLIGFARKTVSGSSAMGAQIVRVYDVVNDIAGVKNLEMNIVNRNLDAVSSSVKTGNPRSINEANQNTQQEVIDYRNTYMANKGLISPSPKQIDKKGQNVTKEVAETATGKWIQSKVIKH